MAVELSTMMCGVKLGATDLGTTEVCMVDPNETCHPVYDLPYILL
jgi:hypothetical protein